jgi:hypothetical protein
MRVGCCFVVVGVVGAAAPIMAQVAETDGAVDSARGFVEARPASQPDRLYGPDCERLAYAQDCAIDCSKKLVTCVYPL